ncbi:hypothetical protein H109_05358 [Trichophyton interdigitale MR816]|uniref:Uncharacterized protein n=1 Tax=Trichophyton interdigitale (strain MR816) TaxID=1215338 RepID=A0A059J4E7_TRIIM|nr:hypothetical protein H109_05358 [Trichophyton interdigitale MR816]
MTVYAAPFSADLSVRQNGFSREPQPELCNAGPRLVMRLSCTQEGKERCFSGGGENVVQAEAESSAAALTRSEPPFRPQAAKTGGGGWWLSRALWYFVNRSRECRLTRYVGDDESHYLSCAWSYG